MEPLKAAPGSCASLRKGPWVPVPSMALYQAQRPLWHWPDSLQEGLRKMLPEAQRGTRQPASAAQPFLPAATLGKRLHDLQNQDIRKPTSLEVMGGLNELTNKALRKPLGIK